MLTGTCPPPPLVFTPGGGLLYDYQLVFQAGQPQLSQWSKAVPAFSYSKSVPYFQMLVPTVDTVRVAALLDVCLAGRRPLLLVGEWPAALHARVTHTRVVTRTYARCGQLRA